ncbi:hypothetical protein NXX48_24295 [Bacteroides faecis]|nr:hypothetical protein [Bacteroides faecis]MCS2977932.1 hypothetical protein [Bacteroides faecis]
MKDGVDGWGNTNWYDKIYGTGTVHTIIYRQPEVVTECVSSHLSVIWMRR